MHGRLASLAVVLASLALAGPAAAQTPIPMTEADAVARAVRESPTLRAALLDLQAADQAVRSAESEHLPVFRASVDGGHGETVSAALAGASPSADDRVGAGVGLGWTSTVGTSIDLDLTGSWRTRGGSSADDAPNAASAGASYGADAALRVTQPLLRGAGRDAGEAGLRAARLSRTAEGHARDEEASALVRDVLSAYWELWYAAQAVEVERAGLELAERQLEEAETRANGLGTLAPADALRFASELASIEERLAQAEEDRRSKAIELGRLLGMGPAEALGIQPDPAAPEVAFDLADEEAIALARERSAELLDLQAQAASAHERVVLAEDSALPRLDLTGSLTVSSLWNDESVAAGELLGGRPAVTGMVGLSLELPVVPSGARAEVAGARLREEAALARLEARAQQVDAQAASLLDRLGTIERRVGLAERSLAIASRLAEAERGRFALGTTTPLGVLEAQASERDAELRVRRALVDQAGAAIDLGHLTGQLLAEHSEPLATSELDQRRVP